MARKAAKAPKVAQRVRYSPEVTARMCAELAKGEAVSAICKQPWACGESTFYEWLAKYPEFLTAYEVAKAQGLERMANEIIAIADTCRTGTKVRETKDGTFSETGDMVDRSRLQIDARKWLLSKLAPKKYGDRVDVEHGGSLTIEVVRFGEGKASG